SGMRMSLFRSGWRELLTHRLLPGCVRTPNHLRDRKKTFWIGATATGIRCSLGEESAPHEPAADFPEVEWRTRAGGRWRRSGRAKNRSAAGDRFVDRCSRANSWPAHIEIGRCWPDSMACPRV